MVKTPVPMMLPITKVVADESPSERVGASPGEESASGLVAGLGGARTICGTCLRLREDRARVSDDEPLSDHGDASSACATAGNSATSLLLTLRRMSPVIVVTQCSGIATSR